jgi:hypothetical protein
VVPRHHNSLICGAEYVPTLLHAHPARLPARRAHGQDLTFTKGLLSNLFTFGKTVFLDTWT